MVLNTAKIDVKCPICGSIEVSKFGKSKTDKQRYICNNKHCKTKTFQLEYNYNVCKSHIDEQIINMTANSRGIRDISRVLKISTYKVMSTIKKQKTISDINTNYIEQKETGCEIEVEIVSYAQVECVELDETWSFVNCKGNQRWLWLALAHNTRTIIAYTFGKCKDAVFEEFHKILEPFGITKFYSDNWKSYSKYLNPAVHEVGKKNTQIIERKNLTLRTRIKRLARKTICFSKSVVMHDIVIGLVINILDFGWSFNKCFQQI